GRLLTREIAAAGDPETARRFVGQDRPRPPALGLGVRFGVGIVGIAEFEVGVAERKQRLEAERAAGKGGRDRRFAVAAGLVALGRRRARKVERDADLRVIATQQEADVAARPEGPAGAERSVVAVEEVVV